MITTRRHASKRKPHRPRPHFMRSKADKFGFGYDDDGPEFVAAIIYHYDTEDRTYRPHSVFTVERLTAAKLDKWASHGRRRHSRIATRPHYGGTDEFDFNHNRRHGYTYYHESGSGGMPYIHPTYHAKRYREHPEHPKKGIFGQPAVWWNPAVADIVSGGTRYRWQKTSALSPATLKFWGWRTLPRPAQLDGPGRDPFTASGNWYPTTGSTEYCPHCKDHICTDDNGSLCPHIWENECEQNGRLCGAVDDPGCQCKTRAECLDRERGLEPEPEEAPEPPDTVPADWCTCPPPPEPYAEDCPVHKEQPHEHECHCTPGQPRNPHCPTHGDDPNDGAIPFPR